MWKGGRVAEAVPGGKSGKYKSYAEAARILGVPESTVYARASGRPTRIQAHEHEQLLSEEEEKEVARWIRQLTNASYPPKPGMDNLGSVSVRSGPMRRT